MAPNIRPGLRHCWRGAHQGRCGRARQQDRKNGVGHDGQGVIAIVMSGAILAVPIEAAERYIPGVYVYKAVPERLFSYPYGGSYLRRAKRSFGNPYVNPYYGSYYAPVDYYNYWAYYVPPTGISTAAEPYGPNGCLQRPCR